MTIRYLIIDSQEDILSGSGRDYVDYLLDMEYSRNPSTLVDIPLSEKEHGDIAYYDTLSENLGRNGSPARNTPLGKLVR